MNPTVDIILLDVHMPDMNGFEVCKRIKAKPMLKDIPIVFVSSTVEFEEGRIQAKGAGGEDLYRAPVEPVSFVGALRKLLRRS